MTKRMLIDATHAEETRVVVLNGNRLDEFDFETSTKKQLKGNIYLAKVTRVEPSLQAAFVDYGGNRHGFLAFSEIHPDYYQIPIADREALIAEERAYAESLRDEGEAETEDVDKPRKVSRSRRSRSRSKSSAANRESGDIVATAEVDRDDVRISGMEVVDFDDDAEEVNGAEDAGEGEALSPMETVAETPVDTPASDDDEEDEGEGSVETVEKDDTIESVAEEDDSEEVRPVRKPRPKRYKIQEVIKVRQIMLVQVVKEERGNKGAALTTYLSLAGRYCVLMPNTARGGGISRKITNAADRKKLKEIAAEIDVPDGAGLIIRTAGSQRTKAEIKRDYEYLQRLWEQIRELTLKSIAPAKIYEEGDLIKRTIRDLYSKEIDEVIVAGEAGYRSAKDFMKMIMPSHAKNVKPYAEQLPLFARYQVEGYLSGMFNPTVQLPSGGYIVIGVTEALVAIDVNSGRATKEGSIEQTALKTNLEAADEVARQLRLRDLAGLIVIDFIDMDERKNNTAVEKRLKDKLKTDRARIQVGRISGFGLLEMSRQRLRPGMLEATTQPCPHCHGTGLLRSDDNVALSILRQLEEEGVRGRSKEVLVRAPVGIANFLMNQKREHIAAIEARYGMAVRIECDVTLVSPDFAIEKFKTATRIVPEAAPITASTILIEEDEDDLVVEDEADEAEEAEAAPAASGENGDKPKKRRRRRRRRRGGNGAAEEQEGAADQGDEGESDEADEPQAAEAAPEEAVTEKAPAAEAEAEAPAKKKSSRSRSRKPKADEAPAEEAAVEAETVSPEEKAPAKAKSTRSRKAPAKKAKDEEVKAEDAPAAETPAADAPAEEAPAKPKTTRSRKAPVKKAAEAEAPVEVHAAEAASEPEAKAEPALAQTEEPSKPKRKGWWSLGR